MNNVSAVPWPVRPDQLNERGCVVLNAGEHTSLPRCQGPYPSMGAPAPFHQDSHGHERGKAESGNGVFFAQPHSQQHHHSEHPHSGRDNQRPPDAGPVGAAPGQHGPDPHQEDQSQHQRTVHLVVKWPRNRDFLSAGQARNEGIHRSPQGHESYGQKQQVVDQEGRLAGQH